ncbi:MAG: CHAT domain-containing protein [Cyanobacteria bacterium P01_D01_bin.50]
MSKSVVINLGNGDLYKGCEQVTSQLWILGNPLPQQFIGSLPPAPNLIELYKRWQLMYQSFYDCLILRSFDEDGDEIEIIESDVTNISDVGFDSLSQNLQAHICTWLNSKEFLNIERKLRSALNPEEEIKVIIQTNDFWLRRIPWYWWDFFEDYPKAEIALFKPDYKRSTTLVQPNWTKNKVRILAVMGNSIGIDPEAENRFLKSLQDAEVKFLIKPSRQKFNSYLWNSQGWDMLFFAGHSHTEEERGRIYINENKTNNSLTLEQLEEALKAAIENGLKLAIFNSCDGLGLASVLEKLSIPTTIVMREPVPNLVAQVFFKFFLEFFAQKRNSLYLSFQQARRQLQGLENKFPGASCLPVIFQNPAVEPPNWLSLGGMPPCPYRGLFAFSESDTDLFFGREMFSFNLLKAVKSKTFVAVVGPSGSGKSSVVFAGLIPRLRQDDSANWQIVSFRPGNKPFEALASALLTLYLSLQNSSATFSHDRSENNRYLAEAELVQRLKHDRQALQKIVEEFTLQNSNTHLVLIVDQFEELYTLCKPRETQFFLDVLLAAVDLAPAFTLVITLRADFYSHALSYRPFSDALQGAVLNLAPMSQEELRSVIEEPAKKMTVKLEHGLANRLIDDVWGELGNLPLLEFALTQLWEKQLAGQLMHDAYSEIGCVQGALAEYGERVYAGFSEVNRKRAKRIFIQLVCCSEGTQPTRRLATRSQVNNWDLVTHLASARLLVTNRNYSTGEETVEIVHEALIKSWGRLEHWIQIDGDFRRWQEQLRGSIYQWESSKEDRGALLRGAPLAIALDWQQKRSEELSIKERNFIQRSQLLSDREIENQNRRRRLTLFGLSFGLIFALILAGFARLQWESSLNNEIKAIARYSQGLMYSGKTLDALIEAIKAKRKLEKVLVVYSNTQDIVESTLTQAVHGAVEYNRLSGHKEIIIEVAFSPVSVATPKEFGKIIASASLDNTVKLWNRKNELLKTLKGHTAPVNTVAFSPQGFGKMIVSGSRDGTIKYWNIDGELLRTFKAHTAAVKRVVISPDGKIIVSASSDNTVKLWNTDGTLINALTGHTAGVKGVAISPDGKLIVSASSDGTVKLWNTDGTLINTLTGYSAGVEGLAISPDGKIIASASEDNTIKLWNTDGSLLKKLSGHQDIVNDISFSPDGKIIASASNDNTIKLWDVKHSTLIKTIKGYKDRFLKVRFAPNTDRKKNSTSKFQKEISQTIAATSLSNHIQLFKLNHPLQTILRGHDSTVNVVAYSPDGKMIASAGNDKIIKLWKPDGTLLKNITGHKNDVYGITFSPDGKKIASTSADKTIKIWQSNGTLLNTLEDHKDRVWTVDFSPDGKKIVSSSMDKTVKIWDIENVNKPTLLKTIKTDTGEIYRVIFSPDGNKIAGASSDKTVKLWKIDGTLLRSFDKSHNLAVVGVAFSPDGKTIASASLDGTVKLWRTDGTLIHTFKGHKAEVWGIAFSPDGNKIASASRDRTIKIWQKDGTLLRTLESHKAGVWGVAFSPDGRKIASAAEDKTVIVWDLERISSNDYLVHGCNWVRDYLRNNPDVSESERGICDGVGD